MKNRFNILIISAVIIGAVFVLVETAIVSQAAPVNNNQNSYREVPKPVSATNIKIAKKVFLSPDDIRGIKGPPINPPGKNKDKKSQEGAATGVLGSLATGTKHAVIIGICDYPGEKWDICKSDGDSLNMYKTLTELYGYDPANIYLFKDMVTATGFGDTAGLPTRANIYNAVMYIKGIAASNDEVVFFFSGHGVAGTANDGDDEGTDEAILVHNYDSSKLAYIWDGELRDWFSGFLTSRVIFAFDTCRAGGMNDIASDNNGNIIAGRTIVMSTGETQSAYVYSKAGDDVDGDGILDGEGLFTHYFVNEGMLQGLADVYDHNNNKMLGEPNDVVVEEAFDYAKENIPPYLKRKQKSVISDNFTDDLLL